MIHLLPEVKSLLLSTWGKSIAGWTGICVNYERPHVERLWRQWGEHRVFLHRLHACDRHVALYHPHPWPSVVWVLPSTFGETYRTDIGVKDQVLTSIESSGGTTFEMLDPDLYHRVYPTGNSLSIMVIGRPFPNPPPPPSNPFVALSEPAATHLLTSVIDRLK